MDVLLNKGEGKKVEIVDLRGGSNFISKLYKLGLKEGVVLLIKKKSKICPVLLEVNGSTVAIGRGMAAKIVVREV